MKYVYWGIGIIIFAIVLSIFDVVYIRYLIPKMILIGLNIYTIVMGISIIKRAFKLIKFQKKIELLKMWPQSN